MDQEVVLEARDDSGIVWPTVGHPGRVPLDALIPDPNQPRRHFDNDEIDSLAETMDPKKGGEQREIVTVKELSDAEKIELDYSPTLHLYQIVSGERRWRAAKRAGLTDIEIRVKAYPSRAHQKLDAFMLNNGRVGLSDIENAVYIDGLARDFGCVTQEEIARNIGEAQHWVSKRLSILKLSPKAQALMSPHIKEHLRLGIETANFLSRLPHNVQDDLLEDMPQGSRVTTRQQIQWLEGQLAKVGVQLPARKQKAGTIRRIVEGYAKIVELKASNLLKNENLKHIFENISPEDAGDLLGRVKDAQNEFGEVVTRLEGLFKDLGESRKVEVPQTTVSTDVFIPQAPPIKTTPNVEVSKREPETREPVVTSPQKSGPVAREALRPTKTNMIGSINKEKVPDAGTVINGRASERVVFVYDEAVIRIVMKPVTREGYIRAWDERRLKFQKLHEEKPAHMPTREEACDPNFPW
ncbi:MAG TPA: ParB/RepB/Spo0J family partition protein [Candidatus Paceibacterota bacterium]|nr:ParB/RepB/Spo0J family partition protein [Candidatus Paceibacterota bacterium]